jgi:glutamine synthetase adenylyltransferase
VESQRRFEEWRRRAEAVASAMPDFLKGTLERLDADYAWDRVRRELDRATARSAYRSLCKAADSNFFRLARLTASVQQQSPTIA